MNARVFAVDTQTNVYAYTTNGGVVIISGSGAPLQTNNICPLPGIAQRDSAGNYYFAGSFDGTQDFGGITLVGGWTNHTFTGQPPQWEAGFPTCFLAKYASNSVLNWVVSFGIQADINRADDAIVNSDGSVVFAFNSSGSPSLVRFSPAGTNLWQVLVNPHAFDPGILRLGGSAGAGGCVLRYAFGGGSVGGWFYDASGNLTPFIGAVGWWKNASSINGRPVLDTNNDAYASGLSLPPATQSLLSEWQAGGTLEWSEPLGTVEQWVLASDARGNIYLAGADGGFAQYNANGTQIWSMTNPTPAIALLVDSSGNRFLTFADGSVARLGTDPPPQLPVILTGPLSQTAFVGDDVNLSVAASGTPPLVYFWFLNGTNLPGATNATLALVNVAASQSGSYSVVVSNAAGFVPVAPALLRVKQVEFYDGGHALANGSYTFDLPPTLTIRSAFTNGPVLHDGWRRPHVQLHPLFHAPRPDAKRHPARHWLQR